MKTTEAPITKEVREDVAKYFENLASKVRSADDFTLDIHKGLEADKFVTIITVKEQRDPMLYGTPDMGHDVPFPEPDVSL